MKKTISLLFALFSVSGYTQEKLISITAEDIATYKLTNSTKIVLKETVNIPIYKDTIVETPDYKTLISKMNEYKYDYDRWLETKKSNEEYDTDIAKIINNLESYIESKENYKVTKPLIDEAQELIFKNRIYEYDKYGRTVNQPIILSPLGLKPQKTRSFLDDPNYKTPVENCLKYCKSINKLGEPIQNRNVENYLESERQLITTKQFETIRIPSSNTNTKSILMLDEFTLVQESELIGTFSISESKYAVLSKSEGYEENELIEIALLNQNLGKLKSLGSEIFTNVNTGKKFLSNNPELLSSMESQKKTIVEKEQAIQGFKKYGTVYYDKERESDMLKIKTGVLKLSNYNLKEVPEFVTIYNTLYTKLENVVNQMPAHIVILKKYYTLHRIQGRNLSQANINAWIKAVNAATPIRMSMHKIIWDDHYGDQGFFPNSKYEGTREDFDLYYNASLNILGL